MEQDGDANLLGHLAVANPPQTEEGQQLLEQLALDEQQEVIQHASENYNLAEKMEDEQQRHDIAQEIFNGFEDDDKSRTGWLDMHTFWLSLYMQQDYAENSDADRSWGATESLPILTEACNQFQARTYKIFFPNETFVSAIPTRKSNQNREELEARAKRVADHMSYQLGVMDKTYKDNKDSLFLGTALHGSFFTKTYNVDPKDNLSKLHFKVDNIRPTDLVVNYNVGPVSIEDLRRKTHIIYTTVGATEDLVNKGYFIEAARPAMGEQGKSPYNVKVDESQGLTPSDSSGIKRDARSVLYEQHFYLDLDGNGEYRPYIGTICAASRKLLRLTIGYEADQSGQPLDNYKQIQYFTHYKYRNNPDGFYGLGMGHDIGDLNSAANVMLRQSMDAATLANDGNMSGFASERLGLEGDEIRMVLGKLIKIPDTIGDFQNSIMMMKFPGPNVALMHLMDAIDQRAQRLASTTEATTGTPSRAEQATTYLASIEQGLEMFSSVQMRIANALGQELQKIYRLNQRYMPFSEYYVINDVPQAVTRLDYADDMMIQPIFDPKFATQSQKVARAQAELQATLQNPVNQGRPEVYDAAFKRYLEALDVSNIEELIPPQPQIENFDDQQVENMFYLMPKESRPLFDVFPDQNHQQHLMELQEFIAQYGPTLDPDQQIDIQKHYQKHQGYFYGQQHGIIGPSNTGGTPPLAARQGDEMAPGSVTSTIPPAQAELLSQIVGGAAPQGGSATGNGTVASAFG